MCSSRSERSLDLKGHSGQSAGLNLRNNVRQLMIEYTCIPQWYYMWVSSLDLEYTDILGCWYFETFCLTLDDGVMVVQKVDFSVLYPRIRDRRTHRPVTSESYKCNFIVACARIIRSRNTMI